jgi:hypothetical protein
VVQRRRGTGFLFESLQAAGVGGERRGEHLDRHVASEPRIAGAVDLAHPTGAKRGDDLVRPKTSARLQGQCAAIIGPRIGRMRRSALLPLVQTGYQ